MADSYVTSQATLRCTFGDKTSKLTVLPIRTVYLTGKPMANISDHIPITNIAPFGKCRTIQYPATGTATAANHGKLTPMPCIPGTVTKWMKGKNDYIIKGEPALLKSSMCRCQWGGVITIVDDGQTETGPVDLSKVAKNNWESMEQDSQGKDSIDTDSVLNGIQFALDVSGMIPLAGAVPDLLNAAISAARGNWTEAGISLLAAVPFIGDVAGATKIAYKGTKFAKKATTALKSAKPFQLAKADNIIKISKTAEVGRPTTISLKESIKNVGPKSFIDKDISIDDLKKCGFSEKDAKEYFREIKRARRDAAFDFYKTETNMTNTKEIVSHIHGIDFNRPVKIDVIPPEGSKSYTLYQYKKIDDKGHPINGRYYSVSKDATPEELGIAPVYTKDGSNQLNMRLQFEETVSEPKKCISSTARGIKDSWSIAGERVQTKGGAIQIFIP